MEPWAHLTKSLLAHHAVSFEGRGGWSKDEGDGQDVSTTVDEELREFEDYISVEHGGCN